jgi:HrpA-like RNA helicase
LTDGLLKERLLHDENLITNQTKTTKPIIFFIDEVHERSINIDLCLGLIARLLTEKSHLKSQVKIIISSATLDSSVPKLFHQIPQINVDEFKMPMLGTLYRVDPFARPNENILDLVQELCQKRQRNDQILCFVSSTSEANQCCQLLKEISHGTIIAYPLIQSQSAVDQQRYIDMGRINIPVYDFVKKHTTLREIRAAESTIKQRRGRLGPTKPGEYYSLYDFEVEEKKYPTPQIRQSELVNIEFALRKSAIQNGLNYMAKFLPDPPSPQAINGAIEDLKRLRESLKDNILSNLCFSFRYFIFT